MPGRKKAAKPGRKVKVETPNIVAGDRQRRQPKSVSKKDKQTGVDEKKLNFAQEIAFKKQTGSVGSDPRIKKNERAEVLPLVFRDQDFSIVSSPYLNQRSYWTPIMAIISDAYSRGYGASSQAIGNPFAPYYSFVYIVQLLENAIQDGTPGATDVPMWLALMYQMLRPMNVPFRTGEIAYKFNPDFTGDNPFGTVPSPTVDWNMLGTSYSFGSASGTGLVVNMYLELISGPAYTPQLGQSSFASLVQYFATRGDYPMWKLVPLTDPLMKTPDPSAYAAVYPEFGNSISGGGGIMTEAFSENFIQSPIFSVFSSYEDQVFRSYSHTRMWGGGGCYLGGRLTELQSLKEIKNKVRPIFKLIDFNEFYEVCGLWLGGVLQQLVTNTTQDDATTNAPLSVQNFRILLRQAIMSMFQESQALVQDLVFQGDADTFYPFIVSAGTCGKNTANSMMLPIVMVENLRALLRRTLQTVDKRGKVNGFLDFVPVWGMWQSDIPLVTNYSYYVEPDIYDIFTVPPSEMAINLIDGSAVTPGPVVVNLDLNGGALTSNLASWNAFVATFAANSGTLSPIGSEEGITVLEVLTLTTEFLPIPQLPPTSPSPVVLPQLSHKTSANPRLSAEKPKHFGTIETPAKRVGEGMPTGGPASSAYNYWTPEVVTSNQKFLSSPWSECQIFWITPTIRTTGVLSDSANAPAYQSNVCEPNFFSLGPFGTNEGIGTPVGMSTTLNKHQVYASMMYGPQASRANSLEDFLTAASAHGRGSFLGQIAGKFIGGLFGQAEMGGEIGGDLF